MTMWLRKPTCLLVVLILTAFLACSRSSTTQQKKEAEEAGGGTRPPAIGHGPQYDPSREKSGITGRVTFEGSRPSLIPIKMASDPACVQAHSGQVYEQTIDVNDKGGLKDVFVYVKAGADKWSYKTWTKPAVLDQDGCVYKPHVLGVMIYQPIEIVNSDSTLHNVHAMPVKNAAWNIGQPMEGMKSIKSFSEPEIMIPVRCDVHHWMSSYIGVVANPFFAVTGDSGEFTIPHVPAGTYQLEAWQEDLGTQDQQVTVLENETTQVNFTFRKS